jgi:hypothetical protein
MTGKNWILIKPRNRTKAMHKFSLFHREFQSPVSSSIALDLVVVIVVTRVLISVVLVVARVLVSVVLVSAVIIAVRSLERGLAYLSLSI